MNFINKLVSYIKIIETKKHIFLLSHMRANTSVFGHILGGHDEIEGYYEMHIGYYSWKSLVRQKLLFYKKHSVKATATYMFDKVLHNEHYVNSILLTKKNAYTIISLREPEQTVKSIMSLYKKVNPQHEFATQKGAVDYYIQRITALTDIALKIQKNYIYIDAQCLRDKTEESLTFLTNELQLTQRLSNKYQTQLLTGKGKSGDNSGTLNLGEIKKGKSDYSKVDIDPEYSFKLKQSYETARNKLVTLADKYLIM